MIRVLPTFSLSQDQVLLSPALVRVCTQGARHQHKQVHRWLLVRARAPQRERRCRRCARFTFCCPA